MQVVILYNLMMLLKCKIQFDCYFLQYFILIIIFSHIDACTSLSYIDIESTKKRNFKVVLDSVNGLLNSITKEG